VDLDNGPLAEKMKSVQVWGTLNNWEVEGSGYRKDPCYVETEENSEKVLEEACKKRKKEDLNPFPVMKET